jgi:hypothetical protein
MGAIEKEVNKNLRILELRPGANLTEVKAAFRRLAKQWHPDMFLGDDGMRRQAEERFKCINRAYAFLCRFYDGRVTEASAALGSLDPVCCQVVEKNHFLINLEPDHALPVIYEVFVSAGLQSISWSTYERVITGIHPPEYAENRPATQITAQLTAREGSTRLKVAHASVRRSDAVLGGLARDLELLPFFKRVLDHPQFEDQVRPALLQTFFRYFQLHDVTVSELKKRTINRRRDESALDVSGLTKNQLLNLLYLAFQAAGVENISWNGYDGFLFGATGWSIRSCGQQVKGHLEGEDREFRVRIASQPLGYDPMGRGPKDDLGRGQEDERRIMEHLLKRLGVEV